MAREIPKTYNHRDIENNWYSRWVAGGHFRPASTGGEFFSMVIPPPNVTGSLHMGHALNNTLQDVLCRYKRMDGFRVLWVPGTDHAGIATQNVVERQLAAEGTDRTQLGREKFIERVWTWRAEAGSTILQQLRALGVSCDWEHERFTMDGHLSRAVKEAFVRLWDDGLLYRAERLINWCPRCRTALADIEVVHEEVDGHLWHIRYPVVNHESAELVVATTRPETMLGDTAVAIHPDDQRYADILGNSANLPLVDRRIPIIADDFVDPEFGTGAVKVTPAHDFNDFEMGVRHHLARISIFDDHARIRGAAFAGEGDDVPSWARPYDGQDRMAARVAVVQALDEQGFLVRVDPYRHAVGKCYRCQTVIEPYLTPQWFVRIGPLAEPAVRAVRQGEIRIIPEGWENSFFAWMENIKDWCVSRQIWWGHQIPAWYCPGCDAAEAWDSTMAVDGSDRRIPANFNPIVGRTKPERCPKCGSDALVQDPDVLDTWFSSGLWPFSTLGWPDQTDDLKAFYPTAALITGFDILFFWVARMMMMGIKFMDEIPFRDVYIHALVRDQEGQKMSKSKGNVIDPLIIIDRYGTDAFRFTLVSLTAMGRDVKLAEDRIAGYQNFVNKLWNASRFVLLNLAAKVVDEGPRSIESLTQEDLDLADRWILSRLNVTIERARGAIEGYRFNDFAHHLYQFTWHEFCDWYIEVSKLSLAERGSKTSAKTQRVLHTVLQTILLLLHPLIPFVTEELWASLTGRENIEVARAADIMVQRYPTRVADMVDAEAERQMTFLTEVVRAIRNLRTEMNVPPAKHIRVMLFGPESPLAFVRDHEALLKALARTDPVEYRSQGERPQRAATAVVETTEIYVPLDAAINLDEERGRLKRALAKLEGELDRIQRKLNNENFMAKARQEIVEKEREKAREVEEKMQALEKSLDRIEALGGA